MGGGWAPEDEQADPLPSPPPPPSADAKDTAKTDTCPCGRNPEPSPPIALWDIEVCTPVQVPKRPGLHTPLHMSLVRVPRLAGRGQHRSHPQGQ